MKLTEILSLYGATTGTIAIVFSAIGAYNNLKDRPWLKLRYRVIKPKPGHKNLGTKRVIVDLSNVGRRRALAYPPELEYVAGTPSLVKIVKHSPDKEWIVGYDWTPIPDTGELPVLRKIEEYDTCTYSYSIPESAKIVRVAVTDSLDRKKIKYSLFGFFRLNFFRFRRLLNPTRFRAI